MLRIVSSDLVEKNDRKDGNIQNEFALLLLQKALHESEGEANRENALFCSKGKR